MEKINLVIHGTGTPESIAKALVLFAEELLEEEANLCFQGEIVHIFREECHCIILPKYL
jgi:hypothetical protein